MVNLIYDGGGVKRPLLQSLSHRLPRLCEVKAGGQ